VPDRDDTKSPTDTARSLRALHIVEMLSRSTTPPTVAQLAARLKVPKTTMARMLRDMLDEGWLVRLPGHGGFVTGPRARVLGLDTLRSTPLMRDCQAVLRDLVHQLDETCNLTAVDGNDVVYVARVESSHHLGVHFDHGARVPMYCTASGKLFLARMSRPERQRALANLPLQRHTPKTITDPGQLAKYLDQPRSKEVGVDNEEFIRGMVAAAVPVVDDRGVTIAAVACHGPTARISIDSLLANVHKLQAAAVAVKSILLGSSGT